MTSLTKSSTYHYVIVLQGPDGVWTLVELPFPCPATVDALTYNMYKKKEVSHNLRPQS